MLEIRGAANAFYVWIDIIRENECLTEKEYYQIEREWWGMFYENFIENH